MGASISFTQNRFSPAEAKALAAFLQNCGLDWVEERLLTRHSGHDIHNGEDPHEKYSLAPVDVFFMLLKHCVDVNPGDFGDAVLRLAQEISIEEGKIEDKELSNQSTQRNKTKLNPKAFAMLADANMMDAKVVKVLGNEELQPNQRKAMMRAEEQEMRLHALEQKRELNRILSARPEKRSTLQHERVVRPVSSKAQRVLECEKLNHQCLQLQEEAYLGNRKIAQMTGENRFNGEEPVVTKNSSGLKVSRLAPHLHAGGQTVTITRGGNSNFSATRRSPNAQKQTQRPATAPSTETALRSTIVVKPVGRVSPTLLKLTGDEALAPEKARKRIGDMYPTKEQMLASKKDHHQVHISTDLLSPHKAITSLGRMASTRFFGASSHSSSSNGQSSESNDENGDHEYQNSPSESSFKDQKSHIRRDHQHDTQQISLSLLPEDANFLVAGRKMSSTSDLHAENKDASLKYSSANGTKRT